MSLTKWLAQWRRLLFRDSRTRPRRRVAGQARSFRPQFELLEDRRLLSGNFGFGSGIGGTGNDFGRAVAADAAGNVYMTGSFSGSADFDPGAGTTTLTSNGGLDIFVAKYDKTGALVWARDVGGHGDDIGAGIAIDSTGNAVVTGQFHKTVDFNPDAAATANLTSTGNGDAFVLKLDKDGKFVWAKDFGGRGTAAGLGVALDTTGNVYTAGYFKGSADFDPATGAGHSVKLTSGPSGAAFVSKLDKDGNFVWAKQMRGSIADDMARAQDIAVDSSGNVFVTGFFAGIVDFDPGKGTSFLRSTGEGTDLNERDIFVTKLDTTGKLVWARRMGGKGVDKGTGIGVDAAGNLYVSGFFTARADLDPGAATNFIASHGGSDAFLTKLNSEGSSVWVKTFGASQDDQAEGHIAFDALNNVYITGSFMGKVAFDPSSTTTSLTSKGSSDLFIAKFDGTGKVLFAKQVGGTKADGGFGIAVDPIGNTYTTGYFSGTADLDPGTATTNATSGGKHDLLIMQLKNVAPVANNVTKSTNEDTAATITLNSDSAHPDVTDADDTVDLKTVKIDTQPAHGTATVNPSTGAITYTPALNFNGTDTFTYKVNDPAGGFSNAATITITVNPINDPPKAQDDLAVVAKNTATVINVLNNDSDVDGTLDVTSVAILSQPAHGTATVNTATGDVTYTPANNYTGPDSFLYTVKDNSGAVSSPAKVSITVTS